MALTHSAIGICGAKVVGVAVLALRLVAQPVSGGIDLCSWHT